MLNEHPSIHTYIYIYIGSTHTLLTPLDLVKCRLQVDAAKYKNVVHGFKLTFKEDGSRGLVKGWAPTAYGYSAQVKKIKMKDFIVILHNHLSFIVIKGIENSYIYPTYVIIIITDNFSLTWWHRSLSCVSWLNEVYLYHIYLCILYIYVTCEFTKVSVMNHRIKIFKILHFFDFCGRVCSNLVSTNCSKSNIVRSLAKRTLSSTVHLCTWLRPHRPNSLLISHWLHSKLPKWRSKRCLAMQTLCVKLHQKWWVKKASALSTRVWSPCGCVRSHTQWWNSLASNVPLNCCTSK